MPDAARGDDQFRTGGAATQLGIASPLERRWNATAVAIQPNFCPECGLMISEKALPEHLITAHDYLTLSGTLLPRSVALTCLWDRVLLTGDPQAHERLCLLLGNGRDPKDKVPYVAALEAEVVRWLDGGSGKQKREIERLIRNLRKSQTARVYYWDLLTAHDLRIRNLARELLLPEVGNLVQYEHTSEREVRRWLDKLCPLEDVWDKIRVCRRLPQFGAAYAPVQACVRQLQEERPVSCPECGRVVTHYQLEAHLRQAHHIYQFQGIARSLADTVAAILAKLCCPTPQHDDWEILEALAHDEFGAQADAFLAMRLAESLKGVADKDQAETINRLAEILAMSQAGARICELMAKAAPGRAVRQLVLIVATRLAQPLPRSFMRALQPLLVRRRAPLELQIRAAAALIATTEKTGAKTQKVLGALVSRCSKTRSLDRLQQLEQYCGALPAITNLHMNIENQIRLACPRCKMEMCRREMMGHLWEQHNLLLDGRSVKQPWNLVKDWIRDYRRRGDPELLTQCRALGQSLDPRAGLQRVHRLVLAYHVNDVEARQVLLAGARQRNASLCPHCYALVGIPDEIMPRPLNESHGRLSLANYCVEVSESRLTPQLTIETPREWVYRGREPGRSLSARGATLVVSLPLVITALACALVLPRLGISPLIPVVTALGLAVFASVVVLMERWSGARALERALDYAWTWLAPRLHAGDFSIDDSTFLAGLALSSISRGNVAARANTLERVVRLTENAVAGAAAPLSHLAALKRLEISDKAAAGSDPVMETAAVLGRCLEGKLPLVFAQQLLADWAANWWTAGNLARLRVLLCDHAFEEGLEVADLIAAGHLAPALSHVLESDNPNALARLRLLWSLRPRQPWERWSKPLIVFDLARDASVGAALLGKYPDLLLADGDSPSIKITGQGVVFEDTLFTRAPRRVETKARKDVTHVDYSLILDDEHFAWPADPAPVVKRLEHWFRFYFGDFATQVAGVFSWQAPAGTKPLRARQAVPCPDCQRLIIPVPGDVGALVGPAQEESN